MITSHQYLDLYPINPKSGKLILGTIHPHDHESFRLPFFYGNRMSFWEIIREAFPGELDAPITLKNVLHFLEKYQISISDTIRQCSRITKSALDKDLEPILLNHELVDQIRNSEIREILFTSGFGKNNAFRLFYADILRQKVTGQIKVERETILPASFFGRPVKLTILYSPAGTANIGLSKSALYNSNKHKYSNALHPVKAFKIDYYREKLK